MESFHLIPFFLLSKIKLEVIVKTDKCIAYDNDVKNVEILQQLMLYDMLYSRNKE